MPKIILDIPTSKLDDFKKGFFKIYPKPKDFKGTDLKWIKEKIIAMVLRVYRLGKTKTAQEGIKRNKDLIK